MLWTFEEAHLLTPTGLITGNLPSWILWSLWIARNNLLFNNRTSKPEDILTKAIARTREWQNGQAKTQLQKRTLVPTRTREERVKCRTDAAWKATGSIAGLGWNIIDGSMPLSFSTFDLNVQSPLVAESIAMREAMAKCIELGLDSACFESDSSQLIYAIN